MNAQIIKGGPALALVMSPSTVTGTTLTENLWNEATVSNNAVVPPIWNGPPIGASNPVPAVGASTVIGSGELSQPAAGSFTIAHTAPCNSQVNSKLFMFTGGQLYESQEFDLVDTSNPPGPPPPAPAPLPAPTLTAQGETVGGVPTILLTVS